VKGLSTQIQGVYTSDLSNIIHKYRIVAMFVTMNIKDMVRVFMICLHTEFYVDSSNYKTQS